MDSQYISVMNRPGRAYGADLFLSDKHIIWRLHDPSAIQKGQLRTARPPEPL